MPKSTNPPTSCIKSGEIRINGVNVFINDKIVASMKPIPPPLVTRNTKEAPTQTPKRVTRRGKPGKPTLRAGKGGATAQKRAALADYWATHKSDYDAWARANGKDHTDCGVFIGKVMRDSGSDPNYPAGSTGTQWDYVHDSDNGWTTGSIGAGGPQPGDVLLHQPYRRASGHVYGHTGLYQGPDPNNAGHVVTDEASLGGHSPEAKSGYTMDSLANTYQIWARPPSGQ